MYKIIKSYCENNSDNGLLLVDMPTGFGKTHSVLEYIFNACQEQKRKFFFITPMKKNLPVEKLEEFFRKNNRLEEFQKKVLVIKSNADMAIENYDDNFPIPDDIKKTEEYKNFSQQVSLLRQLEKNNSFINPKVFEKFKDDFRKNTELAFRYILQQKLKDEFSTVKDRINAIKENKRWQWLSKLYPTVLTNDYQIYFMSMDKFILKNSTIVEPPYMFFDSEIIENSVIFIDEFDSTKEKILTKIIEDSLGNKVDFIEMFKVIYSAMKTKKLPKVYITPSQKRKNSDKYKNLQEIFDDVKKTAEGIYEEYSVQFNYRTDNEDDTQKNFMFQNYKYHTIVDGKKYIYFVTNQNKKMNYIKFSNENPEKDCHNIQSIISAIRGFIKQFQGIVRILAINYKELKEERGKKDFTWEDSLKTVISEFNLNKYYMDYLVSQIMIDSYRKSNSNSLASEFDLSLYEKGFRYYFFENDTKHDMLSKIMMSSFNNTPEKMLLRFCEKAKVIGLSATGTLPTVTGNYDIEYLRHRMGKRFCTISESDSQRLKDDFNKSQCGYSQIKIHSELIEVSGYSLQTWCDIVSDNEIANKIYDKLDREVYENNNNNYNKERYARIAMAFKAFLAHDDIYSFLCFLTKLPKENDRQLDKKLLKEIFKYIAYDFPDVKYDVEFISTEEYDKTKDKLIKRLADGEKIFVISSYQTIGAGQNLQYPIPENLKGKLIHSNNYSPRDEKDFDAVYLDKPTNIIVNITDDWKEESFAKYMFQMEFLQESRELSKADAWTQIKRAFKCYSTGSLKAVNNYPKSWTDVYKCESVKMHATGTIIQAIGRICRTNQKNKNIYIFADSRIKDTINPNIAEKRIFNFEFKSLCDKIRETNTNYSVPDNTVNQAELVSDRASCRIDNIRNYNNWADKTVSEWKIMRDVTLRLPTMSGNEEDEKINMIRYNFFVSLSKPDNKLYYLQEEDFHKINISFFPQLNYNVLNEEKTRLNIFMKWDILREYFIEKGYATSFKPNNYIMSPAVWNNIYKGALGEAVGQFWFSEVLNIELEELENPDIFELFDFKIPDTNIFIDFKNWGENYDIELNKTLEKISAKAEKCNCQLAIIANILATENYRIRLYNCNGKDIVVVPSLLQYNNDKVTIDINAVKKIRRCINEYTD
ncbi:MAG: hypothetical protein NC177_02740 [Ruminococcus flavefaciens]|nr:hypothetical protein [Ruminococcus flavefaciens]